MMTIYTIQWIFIGILGVCIGSFLNVLIYRIPLGISISKPARSFCTSCNTQFSWYLNIPILSWIFLRGKSNCCSSKISVQYPLIETLTSLSFIFVFYVNGFNLQSFLVALVFSLLIALSTIDYYYHAIPDSMSLALLTVSFFTNEFLLSLQAGLIVAGFMTLLRYYVSYFMDKEAIGEGDIIIAAAMGALIGVKLALLSLFVSAIIALPFAYIAKKLDNPVPFVPFLSMGIFLVYIFNDYAEAYLRSIGL